MWKKCRSNIGLGKGNSSSIYLKRKYNARGFVKRYISSIGYLDKDKMEEIYGSDGSKERYSLLSEEAKKMLDLSGVSKRFIATFIGGKK